MYFLKVLVFNIITITYPMLIYLFYSIKQSNINKEKNELIITTCLFTSFFLSLYYNVNIENSNALIFISLPILFSYLFNKTNIALIMSFILIDYYMFKTPSTIPVLIFMLIAYFLVYLIHLIYKSTTMKNNTFTYIFCTLSVLSLLFSNYHDFVTYSKLIETLVNIVVYYIATFTILNYFTEIKNILNINSQFKNIEKDSQIQKSIFKITHEIKNPLSVVKGYLSMFDINNKKKCIKYTKIIENEIDRSLNLLNDFKDFSKININKKKIHTSKLFEDINDTLTMYFKSGNINFKLEYKKDIVIYADYERLKQVLINLLKNSFEACNNNGNIYLKSYKNNNNLFIIVKDDGIGMDKDTLDNIFTLFYTTKSYGTGVGVSLSKEIIEKHNGTLTYTSNIKKGTTAKIILPLN